MCLFVCWLSVLQFVNAVSACDVKLIKEYLDRKDGPPLDINGGISVPASRSPRPLLMYAFDQARIVHVDQQEQCLRLLLDAKADPNFQTMGDFPVIRTTSPTVVRLLLEHKANVNAHNSRGETALTTFTEKGNIKCVEVLLEFKADGNLESTNGLRALDRDSLQLSFFITEYGINRCRELIREAYREFAMPLLQNFLVRDAAGIVVAYLTHEQSLAEAMAETLASYRTVV